jgi:hypothetical protein
LKAKDVFYRVGLKLTCLFFAKIILHFRDNCLQKTYDNDEIVKGKTFQQHVK